MTAANKITAKGRLWTLAVRYNVSHIADLYIQEIYVAVQAQLITPNCFIIKSFHNKRGWIMAVLTINNDNQILLHAGDMTTQFVVNAR